MSNDGDNVYEQGAAQKSVKNDNLARSDPDDSDLKEDRGNSMKERSDRKSVYDEAPTS